MRYYTGVGSRKTPEHALQAMTRMARSLESLGYVLRSGGADGADKAFEAGVADPVNKEIWVPWIGFNGSLSILTPSPAAFDMASEIHPAWTRLSQGARKLHARNIHQVLGSDLKTKSEFLVCWTPNGQDIGGTATAIKVALAYGVKILNLGNGEWT